MKSFNVIAACFLLGAGYVPSAAGQGPSGQPTALPTVVPLSELEIRLNRDSHGGCVGRCVRYRVTIRGNGTVVYEDLATPPIPPRQRTVAVDDVINLGNEFVRARFFEASDSYVGANFYVREGEQLLLRGSGGIDGPSWDLSIRLGRAAKSVHLYMDYPEYLGRLRDLVDQIGGPGAWNGR